MDQFERMDEGSHILKHYLKYHRDLNMEDIKIGMRIRSSFRSAIERQISEAVVIFREEELGTELMNSRAEYNRCKLQRLNTQSIMEQMKEAEKDKRKRSIAQKRNKIDEKEREKQKKKKMIQKVRQKKRILEIMRRI